MGAQYNSRGPARSTNGDRKPAASSDYDPLLPVQYYERVVGGRAPSGELKLFFAILEDALRCYVRTKNCRSGAQCGSVPKFAFSEQEPDVRSNQILPRR